MMTPEELMQLASQLRKPTGDAGVQTGHFMQKGNQQMYHDVLSVLNVKKNNQVLEIGMGNGFYVKNILDQHADVTYTGCDFSSVMVAEAIMMNASYVEEGRAVFLVAKADRLPLKAHAFDTVLTVNTLYFWEQESAVLAELYRVLKVDGLLLISFRPARQMENYPFTPYGFKLFSVEDVQTLLEANRFEICVVYENREPDFDLKGKMMKMENTVVIAKKK